MYSIDLNCDLGESFGRYTLGMDEKVLPYVSSANIACGLHASDPQIMEKTVKMAVASGTGIGAHVGFPDLQGFGRRNMQMTFAEAKACVQYQIGALWAFTKAAGGDLRHVKPHGALYNMAAKDAVLAAAICQGIYEISPKLILVGLSGSEMIAEAKKIGLPYASEVFADRAYEEDGTLVSRTKPGAVIEDENEAIARVLRMVKEGVVTSISGKEIAIEADTVCVHGDNPGALAFVEKIRAALAQKGVQVAPFAGRILR